MQQRGTLDHRTGAELVVRVLAERDAGRVARVRDVDRDRDVRPVAEGGGLGALEADLLLHDGHRQEVAGAPPLSARI